MRLRLPRILRRLPERPVTVVAPIVRLSVFDCSECGELVLANADDGPARCERCGVSF